MSGTLAQFREECVDKCDGFSFTAGSSDIGSGCLKLDCAGSEEGRKGYGENSHDYWKCEDSSPKKYICVKKYSNKWPHCDGIECVKGSNLSDIKTKCLGDASCDGFSFTAGSFGWGAGCLKRQCSGSDEKRKGYGTGTHDYWDCSVEEPTTVNPTASPTFAPTVAPTVALTSSPGEDLLSATFEDFLARCDESDAATSKKDCTGVCGGKFKKGECRKPGSPRKIKCRGLKSDQCIRARCNKAKFNDDGSVKTCAGDSKLEKKK